MDTGLPPPPERSPPPLLPNDDDEDESVDSLLTIKNADFVLEPPFSSVLGPSTSARADETAPQSVGVYTVEDAGPRSKIGFADLLVQDETGLLLTSPSSAVLKRDESSTRVGVGQVFSGTATSELGPDFGTHRTEEDGGKLLESVDEKARVDTIASSVLAGEANNDNSKTTDAKLETTVLDGVNASDRTSALDWTQVGNTTTSIMRPFDMRSVYSPMSTYPTPPYYSSATPPSSGAQTTSGQPNMFVRVRNASASANSGCSGLPLLHHCASGGYRPQEENKQQAAGGSASERDLPLTQLTSPIVYDNALGKDKTLRWSFAGTAPEVALLRHKLENVERELKELRGKHEATMNDYQAVLHQLELCRAAKCRQDVDLANVTSELSRVKAEYDAGCQQRIVLERQVIACLLRSRVSRGWMESVGRLGLR